MKKIQLRSKPVYGLSAVVLAICLVIGFENCSGGFTAATTNAELASASTESGTPVEDRGPDSADNGNPGSASPDSANPGSSSPSPVNPTSPANGNPPTNNNPDPVQTNPVVNCQINSSAAPNQLSDTCLWQVIHDQKSFLNLTEYRPNFPLFSDFAEKTRWIYVPSGSKINNADFASWVFPVGTIFWKQFVLQNKKIETRMTEKISNNQWRFTVYLWLADQSDAIKVETIPTSSNYAFSSVSGIYSGPPLPSTGPNNCLTCHSGGDDKVLGFNAFQLGTISSPRKAFEIENLYDRDWLTNENQTSGIPVGYLARDLNVIGYMQSNCATCHNSQSPALPNFKHRFGSNLHDEPAVDDMIGRALINFKNPDQSEILVRMRSASEPMPPRFAHRQTDDEAIQMIRNWISSPSMRDLPPPDPSNLEATVNTTNQVNLSWDSQEGSTTGYKISYQSGDVAPASCLDGTQVPRTINVTDQIVDGLNPNTSYSFRVCSVNSLDVPDISTGVVVTARTQQVLAPIPPQPRNFTATAFSATQINLSWASGGGSTTGFKVRYNTGTTPPANCTTGLSLDNLGATSAVVTGLTANTNYSFRICSQNSNPTPQLSDGVTASSRTLSIVSPAPPNPRNFVARGGSPTRIDFTWTSGGGSTTGFRVRAVAGTTPPANCNSGAILFSGSPASIAGLDPDKVYAFRLCAVNSNPTPNVSSGVTASARTLKAPAGMISYQTSIRPIFQSKCSNCHNEGTPGLNWLVYVDALRFSASIKNRINLTDSRRMPPSGNPQLTTSQKTLITNWVNQGANP